MNPILKRTSVWLPLVVAVSFVVGLFVGAYLFRLNNAGGARQKLDTILKYVETEYVDEVNIDSIIEASIPDILAKLDPHTVYIPASEIERANSDIEGSFSGIGISFNMSTDTITVVEVISGGPSEKVGLMAGDRIVTIDDSIATGKDWNSNKVQKHLRGEKGTEVKLGVKRHGVKEQLTFIVERGDIPVTSIDASYIVNDSIGYLKINKFSINTYYEFINSMMELKSKGARQYIIDLRGNSGGVMEAAILIANEFLPLGRPIVATHGRIPSAETNTFSDGSGAFQEEDLVVVIDEFSASASEILAGAIQDNDRGLIVGRRSFGKGLVQRQIELPDSSAVRLTRARYYTPSGRCIQKIYNRGAIVDYEREISDRYAHGEAFNADSAFVDRSQTFFTINNREVFGGGGIMPDVFVANDTTGISTYYINVFNAGMPIKYAFYYTDMNRERLSKAKTVDELMTLLPSDDVLLSDFVEFSRREGGIAPRWYYINLSRNLIVSQLKSLVARDILGTSGYYESANRDDNSVVKAIETLTTGEARMPILPSSGDE